jgi:6-phosphogluconolactonase
VKSYSSLFPLNVRVYIENLVTKLQVNTERKVTIMLTGGRSAEALYKSWSRDSFFDHSKITYYFGDERCVPPKHSDSNYGMAVSALFPLGIPENCNIMRMRGEATDRSVEAERYSKLLPESVDILLLSVGPDGHIASLPT